jgi:hypothetical protein
MSRSLFTFALFLSASILPLAAHADAIDDFLITGQGNIITFSLPASPPDVFVPTGAGGATGGFIVLPPTPVTLNGDTSSTSIEFFNGQLFVGPGLNFFEPGVAYTLVGAILYTGSEYTPTFKIGTFDLHQFQGALGQNYTLTITPESTPPAVPEPSSLLLFLSGAAGLLYRVMKPRAPQTFF